MHKLVVIGDSLSQGFMSGAISRPEISYPAWVARAIDECEPFLTPDFAGAGGLPMNIQDVLGELSERYGQKLNWWEFPFAVNAVRKLQDVVEDYWERGRGSQPMSRHEIFHNLAVWGFELRDAFSVTERICRTELKPAKDNWLKQVPENSMYRTARRVLNSDFGSLASDWTQFECARQLAGQGGVENLMVALGANNILGAVTSLSIRHSTEADLHTLPHERKSNVYLPDHFDQLYAKVVEEIRSVGAERVFVGTVPHVTIPPVTRGVKNFSGKYFDFYTRLWVWDDDFDKTKHPHLTRQQVKQLDDFVDKYNKIIKTAAKKNGWAVVDFCELLDNLAYRRQQGSVGFQWPTGLVDALKNNERLSYLVSGNSVTLDTRYPLARSDDPSRLDKGGLISLDGIHPTTVGYGLMADLLIQAMSGAGVDVKREDLQWPDIVAADELLNHTPALLASLQETLGFLDSRGTLSSIFELFG